MHTRSLGRLVSDFVLHSINCAALYHLARRLLVPRIEGCLVTCSCFASPR